MSIVHDDGFGPAGCLERALERCGAWGEFASAVPGNPARSVVIVPELGGFAVDSPAATDPALVEVLIDLFHAHGYTDVTVGAGADASAIWAANRDPYALVDLLGYGYVTPGGHDYEVVDLSDDLGPAPFEPGSVLAGTALNNSWMAADGRVVFSSNRTDDYLGYHLGLATVMRCLPHVDDVYHYRLAAPEPVVVDELLRASPVHLSVIDAMVSSHGWSGGRAPRPLRTDCIIASPDIFLADHVGAIKMGLDPGLSPLIGESTNRSFDRASIDGSLATYRGWRNPDPLLVDSTRRRDASWLWARLLPPWLQVLDPELFPLNSPIDAAMNERVAPFFADVDDDPLASAALLALNAGLGELDALLSGYRLLFDKDGIPRSKVALGFDPAGVPDEEYRGLPGELDGLAQLIEEAPTRAPGLRWRSIDDAVCFSYRRLLPIPFEQFTAAVEVSKTIGYMNDYIGGTVVVLQEDDDGRPLRQAERNLYLPQPNYVGLWGGKPIDVSKIETITYRPGSYTMYWKTIDSRNGSAIHDDGAVTFAACDIGTAVTFLGRQQFVLPPALDPVDRGLDAELRNRLVTDAYSTFFSRTIANLEALVEGREIRIGRPWNEGADPGDHEPMPSIAIEELVDQAIALFDSLSAAGDGSKAPAGAANPSNGYRHIDEDGFTHVGPAGVGRRPECVSRP